MDLLCTDNMIFFVAIDTTQFVWLRRVLSDTWRSMFVYYEEDGNPENLTAEWIVLAEMH